MEPFDITMAQWLAERPEEGDKWMVVLQIYSGLSYIHAKGFVHQDLKPQNIVIKRGGDFPTAAITDFGLSLKATDTYELAEQIESRVGTLYYNGAPDKLLTTAFDLWSLGLVVFYMIMNRCVSKEEYEELLCLEFDEWIERRFMYSGINQESYAHFINLMRGCLQHDRQQRKTMIAEWHERLVNP